MKIRRFKCINNIEFNSNIFPNESKILLITGLSGSGKSHLARDIAKQTNSTIFQVEWLKHKKHISEECKYVLD